MHSPLKPREKGYSLKNTNKTRKKKKEKKEKKNKRRKKGVGGLKLAAGKPTKIKHELMYGRTRGPVMMQILKPQTAEDQEGLSSTHTNIPKAGTKRMMPDSS